jgi:hypothetical protein
MKPITALFLFAMTSVGAACSASTPSQPVEAEAVETAAADSEVQGTLNLNIGLEPESSGSLIVDSNASGGSGGMIVGPGTTGGNFEEVPELDINLSPTSESLLDTDVTTKGEEDEIVRLKPEN